MKMSKPGLGERHSVRTSSSLSAQMLPYASQRSNSSMARVDSSYVPVLESKSVVVIDFGSRYTRIGFNGDFCPSILRSEIVDPESGEVKPLFADGRSEEEDRRILHLFLRKIFFKHLLCSVKDRRILIVESILTPTKNRQRIASVLFETATFSPPAILFAPSHLLHTIPFSISSAMVVDIGFTETLLVPIYEGVTMLNKYECSPICSKLLEERICVLLKKHAHIEMENGEKREILEDDVILLLKMNVIEDIAVRLCFATKMERGNMIQEDNVDFEMAIACPVGFLKEMIVVPGIVRESAAEIFFKSSHCDDDRSIPELILDSITKLPIDMRRPMISHIAVVGGSARMPGFLARLKSEITRLLQEDERYNFLRKLADSLKFYVYSEAPVELYGAWLGGSLLASVDIMQTKSLTREEWLKKNKTVPDWTEKIDEYFTFEKEN